LPRVTWMARTPAGHDSERAAANHAMSVTNKI
jgi:hypothetical protein